MNHVFNQSLDSKIAMTRDLRQLIKKVTKYFLLISSLFFKLFNPYRILNVSLIILY